MKSKLLLIAVVSALYVGSAAQTTRVKDWARGKDTKKDYILYKTNKLTNYDDADAFCKTLPNARLPQVAAKVEADALWHLLNKTRANGYAVWLGAKQEDGIFKWGDGTNVDVKFVGWDTFYPKAGQDYIIYQGSGLIYSVNKDYNVHHILCERTSVGNGGGSGNGRGNGNEGSKLWLDNLMWFPGKDKEYLVYLASRPKDRAKSEAICKLINASLPKLEKDEKAEILALLRPINTFNGVYVQDGENILKKDGSVSPRTVQTIGQVVCERPKK